MALRNKKQEQLRGDLVSDEVIAAKLERANAARAQATQKRGNRTTPVTRQVRALDNDGVHRRNSSDRQLDARDTIERDSELPTQYREAKRLDAPPPRPGYAQRWVTYRIGSAEDEENFDSMLEEGWRPVRRTAVKKVHELAFSSNGPRGQYYVKRGLILMELPQALKVARDRHFKELNKRQNDGVNRSLFKVDNRVMPLLQPERSTRSTQKARRGRLEAAPDEAAEA